MSILQQCASALVCMCSIVCSAACSGRAPGANESSAASAASTAAAPSARVDSGGTATPDRAGSSAPSPAAIDSTPGPIPAAFRGTWDRSAAACRLPSSEMRLRVGADTLHFYEGTGVVVRVAPVISEAGQIVRIETRHAAEGAVERRTQTLDRRGDSLWVKIGADSTVRVRCGASAQR